MKKIIAIGIIGMFILTSFSVFSVAEEQNSSDQITMDYAFEAPVIAAVDINGSIYDQIVIDGAPCGGNPGEPSLPSRGAYILLPQGKKVSEIIVTHGEMMCLGSGHMVEPVGEPVPLSNIDSASLPVPDEKIYSSDEPFPGGFFTKVGTYNCKGYEILVLRLHPVQYIPMSGELFYYPDLSVSVETVEDGDVSSLFRGLKKDEQEIMTKVENPTMVSSYDLNTQQQTIPGQAVPGQSTPPAYDLLIITSEALKDGFEPLKQAHEEDGLSTLIYTVEDIYNGYYPGVDNAEKIRNFIKFAYNTFGIEYVLLGGDDEIIPAAKLWTTDGMFNGDQIYASIPADLYYAGLDGTWNDKSETPYPASKDISINDVGVSGSSGGPVIGPVIDSTDYLVGTDSMQWNYTGGNEIAYFKVIFDPPIDIRGMNWFNFNSKISNINIGIGSIYFQDINVKLYDNRGRILIGAIEFNYKSDDTWTSNHFEIYHKYFFNYKKVESIRISIGETGNACNSDYFKLDGVYFSDYCDEILGEPEEDDLFAEVYVGRACVDNEIEVGNFVNKTIAYMNSEDEYLKDVVMAGEYLYGLQWGKYDLKQLIDKCTKHGYTTIGIPSSKFNIDGLYDKDWPVYDRGGAFLGWPVSEIINRTNEGVHIINSLGHGNYDKFMKTRISDVESFTNEKYCFIYSQACMSGGFDNPEDYDCIAEHYTVKTPNAAFAGIWNARYGLGSLIGTSCPSTRYHREFWDAVFGEDILQIGKANQDSKEDNIWRINKMGMRYVFYELNLFGDPSVQFKYLDSSLSVTMPINYQSTPQSSNPSSQPNNQQSTPTSTTTGSSPTSN